MQPKRGNMMGTTNYDHHLETFRFGSAVAQAAFCRKLAQENRWSLSFTQRVLAEYMRFLILTALGEPVSPSYTVDQAWHLHLLFTDSYWNDLCRNYLPRSLHHFPSAGSAAESENFHQWYMATLASYRRVFGEKPPADIWPEPGQFPTMRIQRVDLNKNWVIPKPTRKSFLKFRTIILMLAIIHLIVPAWPLLRSW